MGDPLELVDLAGPVDGPVTLVEYGDIECAFCGLAEPAVRELLAETADLTYVWRHLPLDDVHPHARLAAEVARDVDGADLSGVGGSPTFFINGRRYHGAYDLSSLTAAVEAAGTRVVLAG